MIRSSFVSCVPAAFVLVGLAASPAAAQSPRTWVSATGNDVNPCSQTSPCRTFAGALLKTNAFGEIDALGPGDFGSLTIDRTITIDGGPGVAVAVGVNIDAIAIVAGSSDVVTLRNLSLDGFANGKGGVGIYGGRSVLIENCFISRFQAGISFQPQGAMTVTVRNTTLENNGFGIIIGPQGAFYARLTAEH